ncbi:MAG TPA: hypothetical protein PKC99_13590 [Anaerolineales bacterium]|nr:hypothetical protein [Anaerolineae bacterium]MCL4824971.1 hypothetical protein [Anaerolineales bacterium]MDL1927308.1 hypothetical protein [Anaerolineae bacterium AMX1]GIK09666.1 MAG: hypothetical protein BroJett001_17320 [Chloroflexota bacterium]HMN00039.1 hypothetical protein [Anaerolineales bacterium]
MSKPNKKRLTFQCWNCSKTFSLTKKITDEQELILSCPFCGAESVAKLHREKKKTVYRGEGDTGQDEWEYTFPTIIQTQTRE